MFVRMSAWSGEKVRTNKVVDLRWVQNERFCPQPRDFAEVKYSNRALWESRLDCRSRIQIALGRTFTDFNLATSDLVRGSRTAKN